MFRVGEEGMGICQSRNSEIKSFRCCGISVKVDGTEDKEIHDESDSESDDPFKDIDEDEGELEENEAIIEDDAAEEDDPQVDSDNS